MSEWQNFAKLLGEENRLLAELNAAALSLTEALVANDPARIEATERRLEAQRVLHGTGYAQRIAMQKRGFGELTLTQVCAYAPQALRAWRDRAQAHRIQQQSLDSRRARALGAYRGGPAARGHRAHRYVPSPRRRPPA
jgi:hypothetical protein